jgi:hypothetical protein
VARGKGWSVYGRIGGGNYIAAPDAETGKEAWRFYTIARPEETRQYVEWSAADKRNGASA